MKQKSPWVKRRIPAEKLQDIQIKMNGQQKCVDGVVIINGVEFGVASEGENHGKGIAGFYFNLQGGEQPKVFVHYHPHQASEEACEALGIEKLPSYPSYSYQNGKLLRDGDVS